MKTILAILTIASCLPLSDSAGEFSLEKIYNKVKNITRPEQEQLEISKNNEQEITTKISESNYAVKSFSSGFFHICYINLSNFLFCFGRNSYGHLGYGDKMNRIDIRNLQPIDIGEKRRLKRVYAGFYITCILLETDDIICIGRNDKGQLGMGSTNHFGGISNETFATATPISLGTGRKVRKFCTHHNYACAVLDNFKIKCFGSNSWGRLGYEDALVRGGELNEMGDNLPFVDVGQDETVLDITCGYSHVCATLNDGVKCWGRNRSGGLGYGDTNFRGRNRDDMGKNLSFVNVSGTVKQLALGLDSSCALLTDDEIKCWGDASSGALGYEDKINRGNETNQMGNSLPVLDIGSGGKASKLVFGYTHVCALLDNGNVKCWGSNQYCQLGYGDNISRGSSLSTMGDFLPIVDFGSRTVIDIDSGGDSTCVQFNDHSFLCWGLNDSGQLGQGHKDNVGCIVGELSNLTSLAITNELTQAPSLLSYPSVTYTPSTYTLSLSTLTPSFNSFNPSTSPTMFDCEENIVTAEITTDINPYYTTWYLKDTKTDTIVMQAGLGYYTQKKTKHKHNYCAKEGTIEFSFEHGLAEWYGEYDLIVNEKLVESVKPNGYFYKEDKIISFCSNNADCDDRNHCTYDTCNNETSACVFTPSFSQDCRTNGQTQALIIRVISKDFSTTASAMELSESFFGHAEYTMKSQFSSCSFDSLNILPFSGLTSTQVNITKGVVDVEIDSETKHKTASALVDEVLNRANTLLGSISEQFNFVVLCLPPGTLISSSESWIAYAYVNSYLSVYNDLNCLYPSVQMHELGHNLGLSHSNDNLNYGDVTGFMGKSSKQLDGPIKCFNAPKSFQLGWYTDGLMVMDIEDILMTEAELVGINDYKKRGFRSTHMKIINSQNGYDYYVSFNVKNGINKGTGEGRNKVLVSKRKIGEYYDDSILLSKLDHNQKFTIYDLGPDGDWNLQIIPSLYLVDADPPYTRISFLKWNAYCSMSSRCDDDNSCTIDQCLENGDSFGCYHTTVDDCTNCGASFSVQLEIFHSPDQLTWDIENLAANRIIKSNSYLTSDLSSYSFEDCIEFGRYKFSIYYPDNITVSNTIAYFNLTLADTILTSGNISGTTYVEYSFVICATDEDCNDYDSCSIDYCNMDKRLCSNKWKDSDEDCSDCHWMTLNIVSDNFPEETTWNLDDYDNDVTALSGDPFLQYMNIYENDQMPTSSGRKKAPSKFGRRKAPTRASSSASKYVSQVNVLEEEDKTVNLKICLSNDVRYRFIIIDSFGDGICCSEGEGSFLLRIDDRVIKSGGNFTSYEEVVFKFVSEEKFCEDHDLGSKFQYINEISTCIYFFLPCKEYGAAVKVIINSDIYADDTSWKIMSGNETKLQGDHYEVAFSEFIATKCLPFGSYSFTIVDAQENGMAFCFDHTCGYQVLIDNKVIIESDGSFGYSKVHNFGICTSDDECDDGDPCSLDTCNAISRTCIFELFCSTCNKTLFEIDVKTDYLFSLTTWELRRLFKQEIIATGGPFVKSYHRYNEKYCIPYGQYSLIMKNSEGRGLTLCENEDCGYTAATNNFTIIEGDGSFSYEKKHIFGTCFDDNGCFDSDPCTIDICNLNSKTCVYHQISCEECGKQNITINLKTDVNAKETFWNITSTRNNTQIISGGPYARGHKVYKESICVPFERYVFVIFDQAGDGLNSCSDFSSLCGYTIHVNDEFFVENDGSFLQSQNHVIAFCNEDEECSDGDKCTIDFCGKTSSLCKFEMECFQCNKNKLIVDINTDENAGYTAWYLLQNKSVVNTGGVYAQSFRNYHHELCFSYGIFSYQMLYRSANRVSLLSSYDVGYSVKINNEKVISSEGFETRNYTLGKEAEDWLIDFIFSSRGTNQNSILLHYFVAKNIRNSQFTSSVFDLNCFSKSDDNLIVVSNTSVIETDDVLNKGEVRVAIDFSLVKDSAFWTEKNNTSGMIQFCVKSELILDPDSKLSVSFSETKISAVIDFASVFILTDFSASKLNPTTIDYERLSKVIACLCDNFHSCVNAPIFHQNSYIKICIKPLETGKYVSNIESLLFYQNGILKYAPIENGSNSGLTTTDTGPIGIVRTRLISRIFDSNEISIMGKVQLYNHITRTLSEGNLETNEYMNSANSAIFQLKFCIYKENTFFRSIISILVLTTIMILGGKIAIRESAAGYTLIGPGKKKKQKAVIKS